MPHTPEPEDLLKTKGPRGFTVTPVVREDRKRRVYFQWPRKGASGGWVKLASDLDWPEGPRRQQSVAEEANTRAQRLSDARRLRQPDSVLERLAMGELPGEEVKPQSTTTTVTIREIMAAAIGPSPRGIAPKGEGSWLARTAFWKENPPPRTGRFDTWTQQARQARREADRIEDMLGPDTDFLALTANDFRALWKTGVADNAVKRIDVALQVSGWAATKYAARGYRAVEMPKKWKGGVAVATKPAALKGVAKAKRFTWREAGHLWRCIYDRANDLHPSLRLALMIGGEVRLGQMVRSTVHHVQEVNGMYYVQPPGSGNKLTCLTQVPIAAHEEFEAALHAAQQRTGDPRLFPQSRHPAGDEFRRLEQIAGVPHRAPYGLRHAMIDVAPFAMAELLQAGDDPLEVSDPVVLHIISHHRTDTVKDGVYRDTPVGQEFVLEPDSPMLALLTAAARVRDHARRVCLMKAGYGEPPVGIMRTGRMRTEDFPDESRELTPT
ncbi:hypothetical protein [Gemmatimonas sp.]|uniref:hypothetical protein n=1 Tax=Gemmatimonas sp. TaxID=1962908 RepID=UPI00286E5F4A|nr:hypothetical protein [Gemmatimonas sp.]